MSGFQLGLGQGNALPLMLQSEESECGLASVAMVAAFHGHRFRLSDLRLRFAVSRKGATLASLIGIAAALKLDSRPLRLDLEQLRELRLPCVIHWDMNHFVVLKSVRARELVVHDPAVGVRSFSHQEFGRHFTGVALELTPAHDFVAEALPRTVSVRSLMGRISGLKRTMAHVFALALALEVVAIGMPFYMQWIVDHALVGSDPELISVLGIGFCFLVVLQSAVGALRGWLLASLSVHVDFQWLGNVFRHLMRLPLEYFEKRQTGTILSSLSSMNTIQETLTASFVQTMVDGTMVVGTVVAMLLYSPLLSATACISVTLYGLLRLVLYRSIRNSKAEEIVCHAKQTTHMLESLRGVQSVRLFGRTQERQIGLMNLLADKSNAHLRVQKFIVTQQAAQTFLLGVERIVVIWLAALAVLRHEFTVGMLLAFIAYKEQFSLRVAGLIDKLFEMRMLGLHAERVADIVHARPEQQYARAEVDLEQIDPCIELRDVRYAYSPHEPEVLSGVDLTIRAGECVAITGVSGCGKTTLAKVLLGLIEPTGGELSVGGHSVRSIGADSLRQLVGTVMQDDFLFTGSVAENICFFDPLPDRERIEHCARLAAVHDEICAMAMGYNSLIGDLGTGLSGGQKQRILLARALYKRPKILVLDEATSHLDVGNEAAVNRAIQALDLTRIIIAHRPETIEMASRVVVLTGGKVDRDFIPSPLSRARRAPTVPLPIDLGDDTLVGVSLPTLLAQARVP